MVKYIYDKYSVKDIVVGESYTGQIKQNSLGGGSKISSKSDPVMSDSVRLNRNNTLTGSGAIYNAEDIRVGVNGYLIYGSYNSDSSGFETMKYGIVTSVALDKSYFDISYKHESYAEKRVQVERTKGNFIETIIAEDGTYPNDGINNGYWYVKKRVANVPPNLNFSVPIYQTIAINTPLIMSGTMHDKDTGDIVTSKVKINNKTITLKTATSEGKDISFEKEFTVKDSKLYDGTSYLMELKRNETYHAEVWAEDNKGGKSEIITIKFDLLPNYAPLLTLKTLDKKVMYEKDTLLIEGTGSDQDIGDALMIKYRIGNSATRTLNAFMSDDKEFTFTKPLQLKEGRLHDGNTAITAKLEGDVTYKLEVWIEDDKGARSTIETRTFTVVPNRPPVMVITATPTGKDLIGNDKLTIKGTATDPDENKMWIDIQINKKAIQTIPVENDVWSFSFTVNDITEGENIITLTARDQYDATHTKQLRITRQVTSTPSLAQTMRYELDTPEAISNITMWVKHLAQTDIKAAASIVAKGAAETFEVMEKVDGISPTGAIETEFSYSPQLAGERATIKFTNPSGITMIMGGMSSAKG